MNDLSLIMGLDLGDSDEMSDTPGAVFHRWLPDGESDALEIPTGHPSARLAIWFERLGVVRDSHIRFDRSKKEVDSEVMARQGALYAGPLRIRLALPVSDAELEALRTHQFEVHAEEAQSPEYEVLGRRILDLVSPHLTRLTAHLKITLGQYWILEYRGWDSRTETLGQHFSRLRTYWRDSRENKWHRFAPTHLGSILRSPWPSFDQLLTTDDWRGLGEVLTNRTDVPPWAIALGRAHQFTSEGELRLAFVEAVVALELALAERIKAIAPIKDEVLSPFWTLPLRTQLVTYAAIATLDPSVVRGAMNAIEIRNKVVHEGMTPSDDSELVPLLIATAAVGGRSIKRPRNPRGTNMLEAPSAAPPK